MKLTQFSDTPTRLWSSSERQTASVRPASWSRAMRWARALCALGWALLATEFTGQAAFVRRFELTVTMSTDNWSGGYDLTINAGVIGYSGNWSLGGASAGGAVSGYLQWPSPWEGVHSFVGKLKQLNMWQGRWEWGNDDWKPASSSMVVIMNDGTRYESGTVQVQSQQWYRYDQKFSLTEAAERIAKLLPNDPAVISSPDRATREWNTEYQFEVSAADGDGSSDLSLAAIVKSGTDVVPSTGLTVSGSNPWTVTIRPNHNKEGTAEIELQLTDRFRPDGTKDKRITKSFRMTYTRPTGYPDLEVVRPPPVVRAGGITETFVIRVWDEFTPSNQIVLSVSPGQVVSRTNDLATISYTSGDSVGTQMVRVTVTDGDGMSRWREVPVTVRADTKFDMPTTDPSATGLFFAPEDTVKVPGATWFKGDFTIEAWVRAVEFRAGMRLLDFGNEGSSENVSLGFAGTGGRLYLQVRNGAAGMQLESTSVLSNTAWAHVAAVLSVQKATLYLNGVEAGVVEGMPIPPAVRRTNNVLGADYSGYLDEVRIWGVARTPGDIRRDMFKPIAPNTEGLVGYWPLNQGRGKTILNEARGGAAASSGSTEPSVATVPAWTDGVPYAMVVSLDEDTSRSFSLPIQRGNSFSSTQLPRYGTLSPTSGAVYGTASFSYTPSSDFFGQDLAVLKVFSSSAPQTTFSAPVAVQFTVNPVNDLPIVGTGGCLEFTGDRSYARANEGSATGLDFSARAGFTLETWLYPTVSSREAEIMGKWAENQTGGYRLLLTASGKLAFARSRADRQGRDLTDLNQMVVSTATIPTYQWTHVAAVYDGTQMLLYINGALANFKDDPFNGLAANAQPLRLAAAWNSAAGQATRCFSGQLTETRVWSVARGATDIAIARSAPLTGSEAGLAAYYRMMEGRGARLYDWAGRGLHNAEVIGTGLWRSTATPLGEVVISEDSRETLVAMPAIDVDRDLLTYEIVTQPAHGAVAPHPEDPTRWAYTPNADYSGPDSFTFRVSDNGGQPQTGTVNVRVMPVNDPPAISQVDSLLIEEGSSPVSVPVFVNDPDSPAASVSLSANSLDQLVLPAGNITLARPSNTQWNLTIAPPSGTFGRVRVRLTATDGDASSSREVLVAIAPAVAFQVLDVPLALPAGGDIPNLQIDEAGRVCGYVAQSGMGDGGFVFDNLLYGGRVTPFEKANSRVNGLAVGADGQTWETGSFREGGQVTAFRRNRGNLVAFGPAAGVSGPVGVAVNRDGTIVGYYANSSGSRQPFRLLRTATGLTTDAAIPGTAGGQPVAINKNGWVAGNSLYDGRERAWLLVGTNLAYLTTYGSQYGQSFGLSDAGRMAGCLKTSPSGAETAAIYRDAPTGWQIINAPSGTAWSSSRANAINEFGQVAGTATLANGQTTAFFFTGRTTYDLNRLIPENSGWTLERALAVNSSGQIAGIGRRALPGGGEERRAFVAVPANVIGKRILRPEGSVARLPMIEMIEGNPGDQGLNSFYWSEVEKSLYAIRPVKARVRWHVTMDISDTNNITIPTYAANIWPKDPQIHVAGAPVTVQPPETGRHYEFASLEYTTIGGASVDSNSKVFTAPTNTIGYSVLRYYRTEGRPVDPNSQSNAFTVARTVYVYDARYLQSTNWPIGTQITDAGHRDHGPLNGFLFFQKTPADAEGAEAAYDRDTRLGSLIPVNRVNRNAPVNDSDLIVVWYRLNELGVAWGERPVLYQPYWPTNAPKIIIASAQGSNLEGNDPITDQSYARARVYVQPDPTLAGFNPNEEHAMLLPSNTAAPDPLVFDTLPPAGSGLQGASLFALRNDLNRYKNYSEPFALLKYYSRAAQQWRIKVFQVVAEQAPYFFVYPGLVGTEIQPPYPLSVLPIMKANRIVRGAEATVQDYKGKIYALAAGLDGGLKEVVARHFYPLQADFFYDLDTVAGDDVAVGTAIAWLDRRTGGVTGVPVDVTYRLKWPAERPVLEVGETLMRAKHGLPGVADMATVQMVYDSVNPELTNGWRVGPGYLTTAPTNAARIYDPLSERHVACGNDFRLPDSVRVDDGPLGRKYFRDLPYHLRLRLSFDPINKWLYFKGVLDEASVGEPLLLPNVMSQGELESLQALDQAPDSRFDQKLAELYDLSRNPNQLDLDGDGTPDEALLVGLQYAVTNTAYDNGLPVVTYDPSRIVLETLPGGLKALTAAAGDNVTVRPNPGQAISLSGANGDYVEAVLPAVANLTAFTWEAWINRAQTAREDVILRQGNNNRPLRVGFTDRGYCFFEFEGQRLLTQTQFLEDAGQWHHWAGTYQRENQRARVYRDGAMVLEAEGLDLMVSLSGPLQIGRRFLGQIDEVRLWHGVARDQSQIQAAKELRLTSGRPELVGYWQMDDVTGSISDSSGYRHRGELRGGVSRVAVADADAQWGVAPRFIALLENNDPLLGGLPVTVKLLEIGPGPFRGDLKVLYPDNVFDERLTLRLSSDFGGEPEGFEFEWYYKPDGPGFKKSDLPVLDASGEISESRGWIAYTPGFGTGKNFITIGEGGESGLLTISDNWFICRYKGYNVGSRRPWSEWIGDPSSKSEPWPMLAEGWIKRVVRGLNPFDERVNDFMNNQASTRVSVVQQAGADYEGDIAFNPNGDHLNRIGLIEAYETVLRRGKSLSTDGTPAVNYQPANDALLFISSRIADLFTLLGNEAMADAADPSIGFTTTGGEYGNVAASIFAFQNQLDSLLEEELCLLRGRDDSAAGVQAAPVYNRLFWNFTLGDGEVAYQQVYNISDQNDDGRVDEEDARVMYPQGHGDAWGQYLTAIATYYELLRNPNFTWLPRSENVLLAGVPVKVDFLDERKFARIAAAKAKCGAEIVDLTYRLNYVEDPNGQWQGYLDTDRARAWGVDDWASRAAVGAYFDWLMANALLPAYDPDPAHTGIDKIDRTTVGELNEMNAQLSGIQQQIDKADQGLNPIGLAKGVVPFDLDPALVDAGQTHFEQIYDRAIDALSNAIGMFNEINGMNRALRGTQDTVEGFAQQVEEQERDYKNRLIEIYGYPYAGDIGPGRTYPSGYDGPDLLHYMYIPTKEISGDTAPPSDSFTAYFKPLVKDFGENGLVFPQDTILGTNWVSLESEAGRSGLNVEYPVSASKYGFVAPASWGLRRAPGELQSAMSDLVQAEAKLKQSLRAYDTLMRQITEAWNGLEGEINVTAEQIAIKKKSMKKQLDFSTVMLSMKELQIVMKRASEIGSAATEITTESLPKVMGLANDTTAPARGMARLGGFLADNALDLISDAAEGVNAGMEFAKEEVDLQTDLDLDAAALQGEKQEELKAALALVRQEAPLRLELYTQKEVIQQTAGRYLAALAAGQRLLEERVAFRKKTAGEATQLRYRDMAFRIFRNDAIQKYRAQFDLAARYTYLAATAYDYESNLIGEDGKAGRRFLTDIVRQRTLGQMNDSNSGTPVAGRMGLADPLARMNQNFRVMKTQMGFNNPQYEENSFSLRSEWFRLRPHNAANPDEVSDLLWRGELKKCRVDDLWQVAQYRRFCRPMAPESAGPQPALVIRFPTTVTFGLNYFGWPLGARDSAYDPSQYSTKIRSAGIWFSGYNGNGLAFAPRVYLIPTGADVLRSPNSDNFETRLWRVIDQKVPVPFPISQAEMRNAAYIPALDNLGGELAAIRKSASFRAYHDAGFTPDQMTRDSRLIGRSVWNTEWMLIIPGGTLLNDANAGLDALIDSVTDIRFSFQTYAYSGN